MSMTEGVCESINMSDHTFLPAVEGSVEAAAAIPKGEAEDGWNTVSPTERYIV